MKWCVDQAGHTDAPDSPMAVSWRKWGRPFGADGTLAQARLGDIAVGRRGPEGSPFGHVAIYITRFKQAGMEWMLLLGGNQDETPLEEGGNKSVRYSWYPREWKANDPTLDPMKAEGKLLSIRHK